MSAFEQAKSCFVNGLTLMANQEWSQAETAFRESLALAPKRTSTLTNLAAALVKQHQSVAALEITAEVLALAPDNTEAWINRGLAWSQQGEFAEAITCHDQAIQLAPRNPDAWANRASALYESERHLEAIASCQRAIELDPAHYLAWTNLAVAYEALERDQEALESFQQAIRLAPDYAEAQWGLSQLLFKLQQFPACWNAFEYRWDIANTTNRRISTTRPVWAGDGGNRLDAPLLLWGEQGVGDQILYASVLNDLVDLPRKKLVAMDKRLISLFQRSMPSFDFLDLARVSDDLGFAEQLPLGSLPRLFRPTLASFAAARHPYLVADPARTADLRKKIARAGKRVVGVSWSSSRTSIGAPKSIRLEQILLQLTSSRLHFVNLQYGDTAAERDALQAQHGIAVQNVEEVDNFNDLDGLAALIEACDIVITTSNTTAHLAGALGKETLLLLPLGKAKLWYWSQQQGQNPWYPSIHMFTQSELGQWQHPLELLKKHLEEKKT